MSEGRPAWAFVGGSPRECPLNAFGVGDGYTVSYCPDGWFPDPRSWGLHARPLIMRFTRDIVRKVVSLRWPDGMPTVVGFLEEGAPLTRSQLQFANHVARRWGIGREDDGKRWAAVAVLELARQWGVPHTAGRTRDNAECWDALCAAQSAVSDNTGVNEAFWWAMSHRLEVLLHARYQLASLPPRLRPLAAWDADASDRAVARDKALELRLDHLAMVLCLSSPADRLYPPWVRSPWGPDDVLDLASMGRIASDGEGCGGNSQGCGGNSEPTA